MKKFNTIEEEAKWLAKENKEANPDIRDVFWFPDSNQIRLIETTELSAYTLSEDEVQPFFFPGFCDDDVCIKHQMAIALIHPDSVRKLKLPKDWGNWDNAKSLEPEQPNNQRSF